MLTESDLAIARGIIAENDCDYSIESELEKQFEGRLGSVYWAMHRERSLDLSAKPRWWYDAAGAEADYNIEDIAALLLQAGQKNTILQRWKGQNNTILQRWKSQGKFDTDISYFMKNLSGDWQPLIKILPKLIEPLNIQLHFELAKKGAIDAARLPKNIISMIAHHAIKENDTVMMNGMFEVWPKQQVMEVLNSTAAMGGASVSDPSFLEVTMEVITPEQLAKIAFNLYHTRDIPDMHSFMDQKPEGLVEQLNKMLPKTNTKRRSTGLLTVLSWLAIQLHKQGKPVDRDLAKLLMDYSSNCELKYYPDVLKALPEDISEAFVLDNLYHDELLRSFCNEKIATAQVNRIVSRSRGDFSVDELGIAEIGLRYPELLITALQEKKIIHRVHLIKALSASDNPIAIPTLIDYLDDTIEEVLLSAVQGLKKQGAAAIDALLSQLESRKKQVRHKACEILMSLDDEHRADPRIIEKAAARLKKEKIVEIKNLLEQLAGTKNKPEISITEQIEVLLAGVTQQELTDFDKAVEAFKANDRFKRRKLKNKENVFGTLMLKSCQDRAFIVAAKGLPESDHYFYTFCSELEMQEELATLGENNEQNALLCIYHWTELIRRNKADYQDHAKELEHAYDRFIDIFGDHAVRAMNQLLSDARLTDMDELWQRYLPLEPTQALQVFNTFHTVASADSLALAMQTFGEKVTPTVLKLLSAKKVGIRNTAAAAFEQVPTPTALPELEAAMAKEKNAKCKTILSRAAFNTAILEMDLEAKLATETALSAQEHAEIDTLLSRYAGPLPKGLELTALPRPHWRSGAPLSDGAMQWALAKLADEGAKSHSTLLAAQVSQWQPQDLKQLLQALNSCYAGDKVSRLGWVLFCTALLGDDEAMYELGKDLDEEARHGSSTVAFYKLQILARKGSPSALSWLDHWSRKARSQGLKQRAMIALDDMADAKGISRDEITDLVATDLGFNLQGQQEFPFGERTLTLSLKDDGTLALNLDGKTLKSAPATRKSDDADELKARRAELSLLRKQIKQVFANAVARLEQAMVTGRRFTAELFGKTWGGNALLAYLGRRVVWSLHHEGQSQCVRLDESNCLVDIDDEPVTWPENAVLTVLHPLNSNDEECAAWQEIFADYEIEPPFPQLTRPVFTLPEEEQALRAVKRYKNTTFPTMRLRSTLERRGWANGSPQDGGGVLWMHKYFAATDTTAVINFSNGFYVGYSDYDETQEISAIDFLSGRYGRELPYRAQSQVLGQVDPIVYSETIADLEAVNQG